MLLANLPSMPFNLSFGHTPLYGCRRDGIQSNSQKSASELQDRSRNSSGRVRGQGSWVGMQSANENFRYGWLDDTSIDGEWVWDSENIFCVNCPLMESAGPMVYRFMPIKGHFGETPSFVTSANG